MLNDAARLMKAIENGEVLLEKGGTVLVHPKKRVLLQSISSALGKQVEGDPVLPEYVRYTLAPKCVSAEFENFAPNTPGDQRQSKLD